ncbi:MAG: hypothetical protein KDE26_01205 [Bacteroidetes bacterium]|nr:hypothetical protein [Bacteroidota bacterium]
MSSSAEKPLKLRILTIILPIIYFLAFGLIGFSDTDQGFIQALSWRVINGEVPYLDFIYVRPPLSIYMHAIPMLIFPEPLVIPAERFLFYLFIALTVFWTTRTLQAYFDFHKIGVSVELFYALAFIFCVHNFPPMPWHTVDGLLWASFGANRIARGKTTFHHSLGLIALFMAGMCKQAFYPLIIMGPALLWILHGRRAFFRGLLGGYLPLLAVVSLILINMPEWGKLFVAQTTASSNLNDLIDTGLIKYIKPFFFVSLPLVFAWRFHILYDWKYLPVSIFGCVFFGLLGLHVFKAMQTSTYIGPSFGFSQGFFLLAIGMALKDFWLNNKASSVQIFLLLISWCTGISWGYANNMLFFAPILFGFIFILYHELGLIVPRYFFGTICILVVWIFATLYQYPYRDSPRSQINQSPGEYFPAFTYIKTGDEFIEKTREFHEIHQSFQGAFTILPAFPLASFITHTNNPLSVDWAHNAEAIYHQNQELLQKELNQQANFVLIQKDKIKEANDPQPYGSLITGYIIDNWEKAWEGTYFVVYRKKQKTDEP